MGLTWGPPGDDRAQVGPMLAPWALLSGIINCKCCMFRITDIRWESNGWGHTGGRWVALFAACATSGGTLQALWRHDKHLYGVTYGQVRDVYVHLLPHNDIIARNLYYSTTTSCTFCSRASPVTIYFGLVIFTFGIDSFISYWRFRSSVSPTGCLYPYASFNVFVWGKFKYFYSSQNA